MANEDVLIVGKLDDKALRQSINDLVEYVDRNTSDMASSFVVSMDMMEGAMKDFAVSQKVSVTLMKEAWKEMSASFDAMFKAQSEASGGGKGSGKGAFDDGTVGQLKELINLEEQRRDKMYLGTEELRKQNELLDEQRAKLRSETTSDPKKLVQQYSSEIKRANLMMDKSLPDAERKLREMLRIKNELRATPILNADAMAALDKKILVLIGRIRDMRQNARGNTLKDVLGMDESSVDAVARKMRALKSIKVGNASEIHQLGSEYQRLSRLQAELLGKGIQLTHSNNYLAQSFGYIRNRVVYAMTLGAITNFVKQMYEVRGQYEMLERSLGILIDDMRRGSELFNELNTMAIKSPFTLVELATGAKQLLAYNFAEEEVVDTTRRLADISAALGVPMERLVYNLGQIRAQTALTARDARDFANSGLAIVPMLAQMYTEEKRFGNEIVTTAQVFDMMSNKMVSYADVMKVINSVTDEGGKFFDFQAKQAETLRVQMANLTLAWNNMLNEIGAENQSALTLPINGLKLLFAHWRMIYEIVRDVAIMYGIYRARAILVAAVNGTLITQGIISGMFQLGRAVGFVASAWRILSAAVAANPIGAIATVLATAAVSFGLLNDNVKQAAEYQEKFGKAGAKTVSDLEMYFDTLANISHESSNYKKVMGELNSILGEYDMELVKETDNQEQLNDKRRIAIQLIKEEILERKHLNEVEQGRSEYEAKVENVRKKLREDLSNAITENFLGIGTINEEIAENAPAIANIISDVIENNISTIAGKTGDEYQKGVEKIFAEINSRMKAIGISESTLNKGWLKNSMFRMFEDDIISDAINNIARAKEELDSYTEAIDNAYEAEKKAAEDGANFNDRVEQTQRRLMDAANDTDKFAKKIESLLRQYGGENIIDFLVKVKTEVPAWMSQKGLTELTQLSARFTALATQAKKAGKESLNVNGAEFSVEQLFQRAAQYSQAAQNKAKYIESRKSATITKEASNALKEYKSALDAVAVAKNRVKQGTADNSLVTEKETEAQNKYNKALKAGVSLEELKKAKEGKNNKGSKKDPLGDALTKEIQLITEMQKLYKDYQKAGVDADKARIASSNEYKKSLIAQNNVLKRFGINGLDSSELVKMDARQLRDYYKNLREIASVKGNTKGIEALEKAISNLNVEITKVDYKKITDGLNSELGKIKDEYELAVELDANPELGDMFADMFGINTSTLPKTFGDALDRAQIIINRKLAEMNITTPFDLMEGNIDSFAKSAGLDKDSALIKELVSAQNAYRDMFKKNITETEKVLDDYIKKYGDYSDKIAEIEASRLEKLKKLNEAYYTEEMRKRPEYIAKLNAIEQGAKKEEQQVDFDEFKNSRYYTMMFENLDYISTKTIRDMRDRVREYIDTAKDLTPEQLKTLISQYEKLEQKVVRRSPFKTLAKDLKEYFKTTKERKAANIEFRNAEKEYNAQSKIVAALNKKYEQAKANTNTSQSYLDFLQIEINAQSDILEIFKKQLELAEKKADKYNLIKKLALEEAAATAQLIAQNLASLAELRDNLQQTFGFDFGDSINAAIDGLTRAGNGLSKAISSLQSGDVVGATSGVVDIIGGIGDSIASIFGDGSARTKRLNKEINKSKETVRQLSMAYDDLERAVEKSLGTAETEAKRAAIANKELQLAELERQKTLEESKRSKDRDDDAIKQYEEDIHSLRNEINDLKEDVVNNLWGEDVKSAAEAFIDAWVQAWRAGETTLDAIQEKMDEMIYNLIKKAMTSKIVETLLNPIYKELDRMTKEGSEGGVALTTNELRQLAQQAGITVGEINTALGEFYGNLEQLGIVSKTEDKSSKLSALQQGIQGITEDAASALEAYMNGVSQQVYYQSDLLTQIRDAVVSFDLDVQVATMAQMLLQLQQSYQVQLAIQNILNGWSNPSGMAVRVEMV